MSNPHRQPGDLLLARFLPDADAETREKAREFFQSLALLLVRVGEKVARMQLAEDSTDLARRPKIRPTPGESSHA